jgi:hypothetical protein
VFDYSSLFVFQFCCRGDQSVQGLHWFMFPGVHKGVLHSAWCSPIHSVNLCAGRFGAGGGDGEKLCQLFSVQHGVGRLSMALGFRMSQSLILVDAIFLLD